jgi:phage gpG-like protein
MKVSYNISPKTRLEDYQFELRATGDRATDLYDVMDDIVDMVLDRNAQAFATRGATTGRYWSPLKGSTIKRKQGISLWAPEDPLVRSGDLMFSLTERNADNQILEIDDDGFYLATTLDYAERHVTGDPGTGMPARPPMTIPAKHAQQYIGMINDFIFGEMEDDG